MTLVLILTLVFCFCFCFLLLACFVIESDMTLSGHDIMIYQIKGNAEIGLCNVVVSVGEGNVLWFYDRSQSFNEPVPLDCGLYRGLVVLPQLRWGRMTKRDEDRCSLFPPGQLDSDRIPVVQAQVKQFVLRAGLAKQRMIWYISTWLLSPCPHWKQEGISFLSSL